jgi:hypothetical protein
MLITFGVVHDRGSVRSFYRIAETSPQRKRSKFPIPVGRKAAQYSTVRNTSATFLNQSVTLLLARSKSK